MSEFKPEIKTTDDLLVLLSQSGIKLRAEGMKLRYHGPKGAMTRELQRELALRKEEILELLGEGKTLTIRAVPGDRTSPLSFSQERLWFLDQLTPGNIAYNVHGSLGLRGALNKAALERSLQEILRRHEVLRTCFPSKEGGPQQAILPAPSPLLRTMDLSSLSGEEKSRQAAALAREEAETPFDLAAGPLFRVALLCLGPEDH
ncbi:MAG: condensation domain-containing protein, partial [Pseudomonadota bacterium]